MCTYKIDPLSILLYKRIEYEFNYTHWQLFRGKVKKDCE